MKNVAIVGGGLAGLTCAFALGQRGIPSVVFEAAGNVGGRCPASTYLLGRDIYTDTFGLIDSLALQEQVVEIPPIAGQFYKGRVYHHRVSSAMGLLSFKGLNIADKALLSRMAYLLARYSSSLDFHHPEIGAGLDDESVAAFVKRELSQNILNYVAGPLISTLFYYGSEETSKLLYLNLARKMFNTRMYTIRGGLRQLTERLAARTSIETGRAVDSLVHSGREYLVNGRPFSDVVVAVPGDAVLRIRGLTDLLEAEDERFFATCRYGRAVTAQMEMDRPSERCYAVSIPKVEGLRAATIIIDDFIDASSVPRGRGRVTIIGGGATVTPQQLSDDFRRIYPETPGSTAGKEWPSALPKFPPGRFRELAAFLSRQRRPGLFFCGDYLMGPFVEAAVTTGTRASAQLRST